MLRLNIPASTQSNDHSHNNLSYLVSTQFFLAMKFLTASTVLFFFYSITCHSQDFDKVEITTEHVRDDVYILFGYGGNIGVLQGEDGFLIVDDQFEPLVEKIGAALAVIGPEGVSYAVNTHFHFDHSDGNKAFGKMGTTLIAHQNARKKLMEDVLLMVPGFDTIVQEAYPGHALPAVTFGSSMSLRLNNQTVNLIHVENAHTDTDVVVHFKESNVLHTGDVFVRYGIPFIDGPNGGSVGGMIRAANTILEMCDDDTLIIPGHGQLSNKSDLMAFRDMLQGIWDRTAELVKAGKGKAEILDSKPASGFPGEMTADYIVLMILEEIGK